MEFLSLFMPPAGGVKLAMKPSAPTSTMPRGSLSKNECTTLMQALDHRLALITTQASGLSALYSSNLRRSIVRESDELVRACEPYGGYESFKHSKRMHIWMAKLAQYPNRSVAEEDPDILAGSPFDKDYGDEQYHSALESTQWRRPTRPITVPGNRFSAHHPYSGRRPVQAFNVLGRGSGSRYGTGKELLVRPRLMDRPKMLPTRREATPTASGSGRLDLRLRTRSPPRTLSVLINPALHRVAAKANPRQLLRCPSPPDDFPDLGDEPYLANVHRRNEEAERLPGSADRGESVTRTTDNAGQTTEATKKPGYPNPRIPAHSKRKEVFVEIPAPARKAIRTPAPPLLPVSPISDDESVPPGPRAPAQKAIHTLAPLVPISTSSGDEFVPPSPFAKAIATRKKKSRFHHRLNALSDNPRRRARGSKASSAGKRELAFKAKLAKTRKEYARVERQNTDRLPKLEQAFETYRRSTEGRDAGLVKRLSKVESAVKKGGALADNRAEDIDGRFLELERKVDDGLSKCQDELSGQTKAVQALTATIHQLFGLIRDVVAVTKELAQATSVEHNRLTQKIQDVSEQVQSGEASSKVLKQMEETMKFVAKLETSLRSLEEKHMTHIATSSLMRDEQVKGVEGRLEGGLMELQRRLAKALGDRIEEMRGQHRSWAMNLQSQFSNMAASVSQLSHGQNLASNTMGYLASRTFQLENTVRDQQNSLERGPATTMDEAGTSAHGLVADASTQVADRSCRTPVEAVPTLRRQVSQSQLSSGSLD
ncbi:hypothetical protein DFP72DRAFT_226226 [Ephemerocybe angulata]|uniref:Uncharacterized protein n=1 Tax=Ephemerocybe angulata TaxID=980116 RepID=A0A8H6H9C2_9AGAR|nr:hypothetical protein DFP72DRAFT_226226 [Tulosesus angulatus]